MINISFAKPSNAATQPGNDSKGTAAEKSSAADKARFDAAIGAGGNSGVQMIGINLSPKTGEAPDQALVRPHAVLQLRSPGPLVAGHRVDQGGSDAGKTDTVSGARGLLVARNTGAARTEGHGEAPNAKAHANPALRTVFDHAVSERRADLEVPSTIANGMEAGRERLVRDMQREFGDPASGASSATFPEATVGEGPSSVDTNRITASMPSPANSSSADAFRPLQPGSSNAMVSNAPMTMSASPAGATAQAFSITAPRISMAEIGQAMHSALAAAQQERPILETREKDLLRAQQERPIDIIIKDDLEAAKAELSLPGGEQELLISTLTQPDESGVVDPEAQKALIERANALLREKYQMILDDYASRIGKRDAAKDETVSA